MQQTSEPVLALGLSLIMGFPTYLSWPDPPCAPGGASSPAIIDSINGGLDV